MFPIGKVVAPPTRLMRPLPFDFNPMRLFSLCCLSLALIAPAEPAKARQTSLEDIRGRLETECAAGRFSGVVVAQVAGREVFKHVCGYTDWEARTPMTEGARFKIFSATKSFTATAVLAMSERGRLNLDDPLGHYLPRSPEAWRGVTLRHLLTHTSGIPDHTELLLDAYLTHGSADHSSALDQVLGNLTADQVTLKTPPGETWAYNNFGYELLAQVLAEVSGIPFHEVLTNDVLRPAGMSSASVELPILEDGRILGSQEPGLVMGYNGEPGRLTQARSYGFVQQGAGSIHASYHDLLAFSASLSRGEVISLETQARVINEAVPISETAKYGFGWIVRSAAGRVYLQHSGGTNGFITDFSRTPDGQIAVVLLSNLGFTNTSISRQLMEALLLSYAAPESSSSNAAQPVSSQP
ncbi:MAG: serine hydrolase domain-containing protein [Brevundimonas sp.]